ncbi:MAG: hypothetical protein FJ316_09950 [SAR202 cluster bacterium]|nr:hypothetical protein [SAR202 cluster bacterium]
MTLIGVAVFFALTWFKRGGEGASAVKVLDKVELHLPHALIIFVAGVASMALPFFLPGLNTGNARPSETLEAPPAATPAGAAAPAVANRPPMVGDIAVEPATVLSGQVVRAQINVSDPDRDRLEVRWATDAGSFPERDTGASVNFQAPASGSFQLTATVSDGVNAPVSVSRIFLVALPTATPAPVPTQSPTPVPAPTQVRAPTPAPVIPTLAPTATPTPLPAPALPDINGRWNYAQGYVELVEVAPNSFVFQDYNLFGSFAGDGTAIRTGSALKLSGMDRVVGIAYTGYLEIVSDRLMRGFLVDFFGNSAFIVFTR